MLTASQIILLVISLLLILVVLMQESKDNVSSTLSGEKSELFKNQKQRGMERVINWVTLGLAVLFVVVSVITVL